MDIRHSRRGFLKSLGAMAAATGLPGWYVEECLAAPPASTKDPLRFGLIGCGGQGRGDAGNAAQFGKFLAVCDVDAAHVADAKKQFPGAEGYSDFRKLLDRKDIDAVICGTADHWHTLVSIAAMKAGKDIYCEKPLTLTIDEGKQLVKVAKETGRILQTGTQQRSDTISASPATWCATSGSASSRRSRSGCPPACGKGRSPSGRCPPGLIGISGTARRQGRLREGADALQLPLLVGLLRRHDDRLGRAPQRHRALGDRPARGRTGERGGQAAHRNDPRRLHRGQRVRGPLYLRQRRGTRLPQHDRQRWHGGVKDASKQQHGIKFIGSNGWICVTRGEIKASDPRSINREAARWRQAVVRKPRPYGQLLRLRPHAQAADLHCRSWAPHREHVPSGRDLDSSRRKLQWDPRKEEYVGDAEANSYVARPMRKPYDYAMV